MHLQGEQTDSPRERLLLRGPGVLSDVELLAVLLGSGSEGRPVSLLATLLLDTFGGIRGLFDADPGRVIDVPGIGPAKLASLLASRELVQRYLEQGVQRGGAITDPGVTRRYLISRLRHHEREVFACLYLDNQHRLIEYEELFFGTIDGANVHPREVVKQVLKHNAAAVILAHNHPSGVSEPSQADQRITDRLRAALALVDVRVLDHMIVGDCEITSFAERGLI
ncbi:MAG: DNA repair protein RadC [Proteobacteria bacterium]|nr:DNA repair protein RadC [Pseudomonadota bacterium]